MYLTFKPKNTVLKQHLKKNVLENAQRRSWKREVLRLHVRSATAIETASAVLTCGQQSPEGTPNTLGVGGDTRQG